jgi:hypothetical protein
MLRKFSHFIGLLFKKSLNVVVNALNSIEVFVGEVGLMTNMTLVMFNEIKLITGMTMFIVGPWGY